MSNFVRFTDSVNLIPLEVPQEVQDYYANMAKQGLLNVKPLRIRIAATHAGKVTRNNGFYLPHKMEAGAKSFTSQYPKPIQVHHESKQDPIGRVIQSGYIDISQPIRNSLADSITLNENETIENFISGRLSWNDAVAFANDWLINDLKVSTDEDYEGLGYIEIVASITDPDAIQKILDGRYLTGSVGATTNRAVCSVCKQDWAAEGKCDHKPGKIYDDKKCVIIAGDLNYDEYSFVNKPADRHSRIIEINLNGIQDFVTVDSDDDLPEITLVVDKLDYFKEELNMTFKNALELAQKQERFKDKETLMDDVKRLADEHKDLDEEKLYKLLDETYTPSDKKKSEEEEHVADNKSKQKDLPSGLTEEQVAKLVSDGIDLALKKQDDAKAVAQAEAVKAASVDDAVKKAVATITKERNDLQIRLDAVRKEIRYLHADIESLTNSSAEHVSDARCARMEHIVLLQQLTGKDIDIEKISDSLKEKTSDELVVILKDAGNKVDTQKIIDTLNSGLSNNPTGTVNNPTSIKDNGKPTEKQSKLSSGHKKQLRMNWLQLRTSHGIEAADQWLTDICKTNEINVEEVIPVKEQS